MTRDACHISRLLVKSASSIGFHSGRPDASAASDRAVEFLRSIDTPTVCNLVEIVLPERRGHGYAVRHLHCPFPELPPMVGFARTVTFRAKDAVPLGQEIGRA